MEVNQHDKKDNTREKKKNEEQIISNEQRDKQGHTAKRKDNEMKGGYIKDMKKWELKLNELITPLKQSVLKKNEMEGKLEHRERRFTRCKRKENTMTMCEQKEDKFTMCEQRGTGEDMDLSIRKKKERRNMSKQKNEGMIMNVPEKEKNMEENECKKDIDMEDLWTLAVTSPDDQMNVQLKTQMNTQIKTQMNDQMNTCTNSQMNEQMRIPVICSGNFSYRQLEKKTPSTIYPPETHSYMNQDIYEQCNTNYNNDENNCHTENMSNQVNHDIKDQMHSSLISPGCVNCGQQLEMEATHAHYSPDVAFYTPKDTYKFCSNNCNNSGNSNSYHHSNFSFHSNTNSIHENFLQDNNSSNSSFHSKSSNYHDSLSYCSNTLDYHGNFSHHGSSNDSCNNFDHYSNRTAMTTLTTRNAMTI